LIGLSAALPTAHPLAQGGPVASYRWLGEALVHALNDAGVTAAQALAPDAVRGVPAEPALAWACFGGLSPWEAVVDGRKITGLAQVRRRTGVLLVAGVLLEVPPWWQLCAALGRPAHEARLLGARTTAASEHARGDATAALRQALPVRLGAALLTD
jgi:lipoate-protein ligase A